MINFTEIGYIAGSNKDTVKTALERVMYNLAEKVRRTGKVIMDIPHVGLLAGRRNVIGVKFKSHLI